ncbi:MAG: bifunctional riboflavin kinase/FMN adenylyltransferase [Chloroflexi bacterium]|nr:bifunctional riboflavin kinase/FMN adenylyltransferase [Chloroflexota bacterium]
MEIRHLREGHSDGTAVVATLGTFDGVHVGHQAVLGRTVMEARRRAVPSAVVTFAGHPAEVLRPESAPLLLTDLDQRLDLIAACGLDTAYLVDFDEEIAGWSAEKFMEDVLVGQLGAVALVVGPDAHFGNRREGNLEFLRAAGPGLGLEVVLVDEAREMPLTLESISSTAIRRALRGGDVAQAARMLGRLYAVSGEVIMGDQRGRTIGFPTANISLSKDRAWPSDGVYAGWFERADGSSHPCAVNIGRRPTFHLHAECSLLEAHLIDFDADLYGESCTVSFVDFLRSERRFDGVESLVAQLKDDIAETRRVLHC